MGQLSYLLQLMKMTQETESEGDTGRPWLNHVVTGTDLTTNTSTSHIQLSLAQLQGTHSPTAQSRQLQATYPWSRQLLATYPQPRQLQVTYPQSRQLQATHPQSRQLQATHPLSRQLQATYPQLRWQQTQIH